MEPYVVHWLEGIEHEYRVKWGYCPRKQDYIYFIKSPETPKRPLDGIIVEACGVGPIFDPQLATQISSHSPVSVKAILEGMWRYPKELFSSTKVDKEIPKVYEIGAPTSRTTDILVERQSIKDHKHERKKSILESKSSFSSPSFQELRVAGIHIHPLHGRPPRVVAKVTIPYPSPYGLGEIFEEPDLQSYLDLIQLKNRQVGDDTRQTFSRNA